jgi:hypothetical protein
VSYLWRYAHGLSTLCCECGHLFQDTDQEEKDSKMATAVGPVLDPQPVNRRRLIVFYVLLVICVVAVGRTMPVLTQNVTGPYKFGSFIGMLVWVIITVRVYTRMNPATRARTTSTGKWMVPSILTVVGVIFETLETRRPGVGFLMVVSGIALALVNHLRRRIATNSDIVT